MRKSGFKVVWFLAILCVCIDFFTKGWIFTSFKPAFSSYTIFPYGGHGVFQNFFWGIDLCIQKVINLGGAWGIFSQFTIILVGLRIALVALLFFKLVRGSSKEKGYGCLVFITWGALANIIDYFRFSGVVDWIHLTLWGYSFPVFNIADMMISLGVAFWAIQIIGQKRGKDRKNVVT
ncbi:signal peptidase II [Candidatus Aerophobetes bacterium]|uniref:Lipoprotein signal peptidase n=1 Tax=Aerophobetes bacterium TaxID=2030807 RepID=A0A2A4X267_UNCAE|nr:MAG: signal peptidase II [Candidatus Aerophobetes bacterium]